MWILCFQDFINTKKVSFQRSGGYNDKVYSYSIFFTTKNILVVCLLYICSLRSMIIISFRISYKVRGWLAVD